MESIGEGWLTKSPRNKRGLLGMFASQWRRRYFVLFFTSRNSSRFILNYYEDERLQSKIGTVDLENCEEIVDNVESSYYQFIFLLRTIHRGHQRTYYFAAEDEVELKSWVGKLRSVLNLQEDKDFLDDVQLGLQLSKKKPTSRFDSGSHMRRGCRKARKSKEKSKSDEQPEGVGSDDISSTELCSTSQRRSKSLGSSDLGSSSDQLQIVYAGGSVFYSRANPTKAKSDGRLADRRSTEFGLVKDGSRRSSAKAKESQINGSATKSSTTYDNHVVSRKTSATMATVSSANGPTSDAAAFPDVFDNDDDSAVSESPKSMSGFGVKSQVSCSSSSELVYEEFSIEEVETILFNDARKLTDAEDRQKLISRSDAGIRSEVCDRLLFPLSSSTNETPDDKGAAFNPAPTTSVGSQQFLCLTKGSRRYRKRPNIRPETVTPSIGDNDYRVPVPLLKHQTKFERNGFTINI